MAKFKIYKLFFWLCLLIIPAIAALQLKSKVIPAPEKPTEKQPNILFCIADDASY